MQDTMQTWTADRILSLAPDASSAKSGRELASPRKWQHIGRGETALWGEHQGSGSQPYRTAIDLAEPAFKCSCPSRKFPCKHAIGLFLVFAGDPSAFPAGLPPQWAAEWLASRAEMAARAAKREERKEQKASDPKAGARAEKAQARQAAQRKARVDRGVEDLDRWLCDLIRTGFSTPSLASPSFWEAQAARLVDAQAPGLARIVRDMGAYAMPTGADGMRHTRLLEEAGRLHLLLQAYNRLDTLPPPLQDEVRTLVGWTQDQAGLLASATTLPGAYRATGRWVVVYQQITDEDKLRVQRTYLWGVEEARSALVFDFAFGNAPLDKSMAVGTQFEAELVYFPGAYPLRALVRERLSQATEATGAEAWTIPHAISVYSDALCLNPWLDDFPMLLQDVVPVCNVDDVGRWQIDHLRNPQGDCLPTNPLGDTNWYLSLMSLSGGHPIAVFGLWNGRHLSVLNAWGQ
ncbi:MAG: SWIM zinc finger family protein [Chloroflexia bacterium]